MMPIYQRRLIVLSAFLTVWGIIAVARLFQIQVLRHGHYVDRAARQQERTISLSPTRGSILDREGRILAESIVAQSVYADPQAIGDVKKTAKALAAVKELGLGEKELLRRLGGSGEFAWIARQVSREAAQQIGALKLQGIYLLDEHKRFYPKGPLAAPVLGYVSLDGDGLAGVEHSLDHHVRGKQGKVTLLRDAKRGMYLVGGEGANAPVDGLHVVLTIDEVIQFLSERALQRAIERYRATSGSVVVLEPRSGAVLAMASYPSFDPNRFREAAPSSWRNRTVQDLYEPGSTFKIVTAAAGIEERLVTPSQIIDCNQGSIEIANVRIREHGGNQYGLMTFEDVLAHSSNVGVIRVGLALGKERLYDYVRRFGFGKRTGIELPGEANGILRTPARWSMLSNAIISMGQEVAVTPLQVAQAAATIANGGLKPPVHLVDRVIDARGNVVHRPVRRPAERVVSERTAAVLNEMLKSVVVRGTGQNAALVEHVVAGKTGTAQKAVRGGYSPDKFVASFVGYVPADRPRLVILVTVDEPRGAQYGGTVAAPVFQEIAEASLRYLEVEPSIPGRSLTPRVLPLATIPKENSKVATGSGVPDLRGLDARTAIAVAVRSGFHVTVAGNGVVTAQEPEPGAAADSTRKVVLKMTKLESGR